MASRLGQSAGRAAGRTYHRSKKGVATGTEALEVRMRGERGCDGSALGALTLASVPMRGATRVVRCGVRAGRIVSPDPRVRATSAAKGAYDEATPEPIVTNDEDDRSAGEMTVRGALVRVGTLTESIDHYGLPPAGNGADRTTGA